MKIKRSLVIALAGLAPILGGISAYAFYESATAPAVTGPASTPDPSLQMPSPAPSITPAKPDKHAMLGDVMATASTYLGISAADLKSQVQSGKSLADIAATTPGKSREGLIAALTASADQKLDATRIAQLVDRTITPK